MRTRDPNLQTPPVHTQRPHGHGGIVFLSTVAFIFSTLSLLVSGFLAYRFLDLREEFRNSPLNSGLLQPNPTITAPGTSSTQETTIEPGTTPSSATTLPAGQFIQPAISNKAQVELVSVERVQEPDTRTRNIVNVLFRVSRLNTTPTDIDYSEGLLYSEQTTARNPATGQTYKAVNPNKTNNTISLKDLAPGTSVEGKVSLRVPDGVNTLDISIPKTQPFRNVPINN